MISAALLFTLSLVAAPSYESAKEQTRKILADDGYGFCNDPKFPLTDAEARWCPPVGPDKNPRCPAFPSACQAPRAVLQDLGRLDFSRGGEGKSDVGTDPPPAKDDPSEDDKPGETKSGKRKDPRRETYADPTAQMPELGGLGYILFWVILGGGVLALVLAVVSNSSRYKPEDEVPTSPPDTDAVPAPARPGAQDQLVRDVGSLLEQARAAASAGDYGRAIQRVHAALLHRLDHDGLIRVAPFRTNGDYVRDLAPQPDLRGSVRQIVRDVEQVQFGTAPADASLYERVLKRVVPIATRRGDTLVLLLAACSLFSCDPDNSYPFDRSPSGASAVIELGAAYDLEIKFRSTALADLDRSEPLDVDRGRTLVLLHDAPDPTASEWDRLLDWADNGHHLVLAGLPPPSELNLHIETGASGHVLRVSDGFDLGETDPLDLLTADDARLVRDNTDGTPLLEHADGELYAVQYERGYRGGDITVFADDRLFTNGGLMLRDNPEFLVRFLKDLGGKEVELVDGLLDLGADTPAEAIANTRLTPVILQLLALMAILFFWRGVRFGRPHDPPSRSRRHFSEHIEALGTHYARARASRHAVRLYAAWALERLREKTQSTRTPGLYPLAQAIAGRTGDDESRVMETLVEASSLQGDAGDPRIAYSRKAVAGANLDDLRLMQDLARLVRLVGGPR
ncbi:MAG TPA: DUF4350 domain-containing protein [Nannocystis sp.]